MKRSAQRGKSWNEVRSKKLSGALYAVCRTQEGAGCGCRLPFFFLLFFAALILSESARGQSDEPFGGLLMGLHPGEHLFVEAGYGVARIVGGAHTAIGMTGVTLSAEVKPTETVIVAPRVTAWFTFLFAAGLGVGYYTDFDGGTLLVQPELGLGLLGGRVTWRINLPIGEEIPGLNSSELSVNAFLPL